MNKLILFLLILSLFVVFFNIPYYPYPVYTLPYGCVYTDGGIKCYFQTTPIPPPPGCGGFPTGSVDFCR